ncbi:hypothetical protein [Enterobacteria phage UAB_Phi20]|nr:hypothetical protein BI085_gp78 [Enterobacteria phage UAB_Phi20]ADM32330.1 hypothetical protein [Enterobacteria phage UAB_Phi20]
MRFEIGLPRCRRFRLVKSVLLTPLGDKRFLGTSGRQL